MERKLEIVTENCPQNHKCPAVNVCPVGALSQNEFEAPKIDYEKCKSLVLKYIYYPQVDGGFMYTDRFSSYPMPVLNDIPVDGALVIK